MGDSKLFALIDDAERLLVQGEYYKAEKVSRKALEQAAKLSDPMEKVLLGDRAAAVFLQALYETNRFSSAKPLLVSAFGSMLSAPPTTLLLWLSLALDTDESCQAHTLMLHLLQSGPCRQSEDSLICPWTRRQYLALLHLYVIEVLLPALRDPSEVRLWLQRQPFLPLDLQERQFLEDEVEAAAAATSSDTGGGGGATGEVGEPKADADSRRRRVDCSLMPGSSSSPSPPLFNPKTGKHRKDGSPTGRLAHDSDPSVDDVSVHSGILAGTRGRGPDLGLSPVPSPLPFGPSPTDYASPERSARSSLDRRGGGSWEQQQAPKQQQQQDDDKYANAELDWLGKAQQAAFDTIGAIYYGTKELITSQKSNETMPASSRYGKRGENTAAASQTTDGATAATAAAAAVFLYAAYSERDSLKKVATSALRGLGRGFSDLFGMASAFTPNPMMAPRQ